MLMDKVARQSISRCAVSGVGEVRRRRVQQRRAASACTHPAGAVAAGAFRPPQRAPRRRTLAGSSAYDHPALYSAEDAFSERSYWDKRFQDETLGYEWYRGYQSLRPILTRHLPRGAPLLQVGVGTSGLQVSMAVEDGFGPIHSVDYSPVCIERLEAARAAAPAELQGALSYGVADIRRMPQLPDGSFAGAFDKGALDALLCGDDGEADAAKALAEAWRVLRPGAPYVIVTSASPRVRLPLLTSPLPGSGSGSGSGNCGSPWSRVLVYEVGQQAALEGPFDVAADPGAVAGLPRLGYSHFVYVCFKTA